ncbi:pyridoxal-5'-phosphate-dependent protein [Curtobacterium sp. MCPF17_047]|uniref:DegT/DnrJ/EryC1/StrS family aminotransferase n=1 Tax=unclassified Curtobacterium TaxID=257496 RepID=UPI000DA9CAE9|nr:MULTISPECIES: aminotransferase class I/II-fold pyridoxal phosphate-dependent enzyme [unclassified Curtobacterium]PZE61643.1 pyridoxal-5'-phosphate-dependent protein [Curtobacterium sp. MCPF17_001]PZF67113.1 pyridoxal-5'-phosphate-dependent protein [Curtobacterium sp. MCPF17_047]WIB11725.1 aminotransferase class I/II-fold pyridoxal phosphate-dependent enzyme [Curtobacterium sp. MCPF17_052]
MHSPIPLSSPDVGLAESTAVAAAIASGWVAPVGPDLDAFECEAAARMGRRHGIGLASGTAALHLALLAADVGPGDVVPTSTMTFAATANAIRYTGAHPFFIDSVECDGNIDVELLAAAIGRIRASGRRIGAVLPVDLLGHAVDYPALEEICRVEGIPLIADAAESFGTLHAGRAAASFGSASCVSFNGNKIMTTSGGGMVFTDDDETAARIRYLATQARQPVPHYEHVDIGYNYRLSNVLAALGRAQLGRLDEMIARRRSFRSAYRALFEQVDGVRVLGRGGDDHLENCWLTAVVVDPETTGWTKDDLAAALAGEGIETRPLWKPMHLQPVHVGAEAVLTGVAERLFQHGLALPSGSAMSDDDFTRVCETIRRFLP